MDKFLRNALYSTVTNVNFDAERFVVEFALKAGEINIKTWEGSLSPVSCVDNPKLCKGE